ncbi:MAG: rhodanese-like domain-containing protein [Micavibrio sp.]|nr:rhodanese-like domain-containing protein [Micavibrio sp.]
MTTPKSAAPGAVPFDKGCVVIDVRTGVEHTGVSLQQPHHHIPLGDLDAVKFLRENKVGADQAVYMLCRSGKRATQAAEAFIAAGHENVHVIEGGIIACEASGIAVRKGEVISLERQVRIAAGSLVTLGVVLGVFVSPWLYALSAFVGCGLVFAGVTDSCGMAFVLAKAPWNKQLSQQPQTNSCCAKSAACSAPVTVSETPDIRMPEGTIFYSPATGKPAPLANIHAITKTGASTGGCS